MTTDTYWKDILFYRAFNTDSENVSYLYRGLSFSFVESKRYWVPKSKEDFKVGMIVEYFNNNQWNKKQILDLDQEFDKMYNLLIKYNKLRVPMWVGLKTY